MTQRSNPIRVHLTFDLPADIGLHPHGNGTTAETTSLPVGGTSTASPTVTPAPVLECSHNEDYSQIVWYGERFNFTPAQRLIVQCLWEAMEKGFPAVAVSRLISVSGTNATRLESVFRRCTAWNVVVVRGHPRGYPPNTYMLNRFRCEHK